MTESNEFYSNHSNLNAFSFNYYEYPIVITNHTTRINIENENEISVIEQFIICNNQNITLNQINILIDPPYRQLEIRDILTQTPLSFATPSHPNLIQINLQTELGTNETTEIEMIYLINFQPIQAVGKPPRYLFNYNRTASYFTVEYLLSIRLPRDRFIPDEENIIPYFPEDAFVEETGRAVYLNWKYENINENQKIYVHVFYEERETRSPSFWIIFTSILSGLSLGIIITFILMKMNEKKLLLNMSKVYLTKTQKDLLAIIIENESKIIQGDLIRISGFTKTKVSRNLLPLETNGFIIRERWGRESKIFLTEKGKKVLK